MRRVIIGLLCCGCCVALPLLMTAADEDSKPAETGVAGGPSASTVEVPKPLKLILEGATPLNPQKSVHLDKTKGRVLLTTRVCLREGLLEMLICKARTKEHESILSADTDAYVVHGALLALGAKAGRPVRFQPEYQPPQGDHIEIWVNWVDEDGKVQRADSRTWVRGLTQRYFVEPLAALPKGVTLKKDSELKYDPERKELFWFSTMTGPQLETLLKLSSDEAFQKALRKIHADSQPREMKADFVFGGSGFHEAKDGTKYYQAEGGNLVCVANFSDAMIDVSVRSSDVNNEASFEPYTERLPPLGTPVVVELAPVKTVEPKK